MIGRSERGGRAREVFDGGNGGDSHTMADEVADIVAEEKARYDFLRQQANNRGQNQPPQSGDSRR